MEKCKELIIFMSNENFIYFLDNAYKPKCDYKEVNLIEPKSYDLELWKLFLCLYFLNDNIYTTYSSLDLKFRKPLMKINILLEKEYNLMLNNNEKFNQNIFEIENIKNAFNEIDKLHSEVANKFQKCKKNKLLKLESLEMNYSNFINFIHSEHKYNLGKFLNNYCITIIEIPKLILKTKYLQKKKTKIIFSFVKDLLFLVLSILSIILAIVALK